MSNLQVLKSSADVDGVRIFVAGNNALEIFWLEMVCKGSRMPYTIEIASDAETAKSYLDHLAVDGNSGPDLILFDASLPAAPPIEVLEKMASGSLVPLFVMLSADAPSVWWDRARSRRCLHKPFTHSHLQSCLAASTAFRNAKSSK